MPDRTGVLVISQPSDGTQKDWLQQTVSIAADYETAFGAPPPRILGLAISSDTDDTGAAAVSRIRDIEFTP